MKLSGLQRRRLTKALQSAFPRKGSLERMVNYVLEQNLSSVAEGGDLDEVVFNLIVWAESHDKLEDLIKGAYEENPDNHQLYLFAVEVGIVKSSQQFIQFNLDKVRSIRDQVRAGIQLDLAPTCPPDWQTYAFKCNTWTCPVYPLFGDGKHVYRVEDLRWRHESTQVNLPPEVQSVYQDLLTIAKDNTSARGRNIFDNSLPHFARWLAETDLNERIDIFTKSTTFYEWFTISNFLDAKDLVTEGNGKPTTLRHHFIPDPTNADGRTLPVAMVVNFFLIVDEGRSLIVGERSKRVGPFPNSYAAPVGGFMELAKDYHEVRPEQRHFGHAIIREAVEEMSLGELTTNDLRLLGMAMSLVDESVGLLAYAVLPTLTADDVANRLAQSGDGFRKRHVVDISSPGAVVQLLQENNWPPTDGFGLFLTLKHHLRLEDGELYRLFA